MSKAQTKIGRVIRIQRELQRLSLESLAGKAGISYQYLSGIETGKENFTIQVLESLSTALGVSVEQLITGSVMQAIPSESPQVLNQEYFRNEVPLPEGLSITELETTLNHTQQMIYQINISLVQETGRSLQSLIQGNNFSGIVSNLLSNSFNMHTSFKHNHDQRYPDLINKINSESQVGLEIKTTVNIGKGGESHNGHGGWHIIACYKFSGDCNIKFVHVMFANLNGHNEIDPDWKYLGSSVNEDTGSQRTETYLTNLFGTTKLRDGSIYLDSSMVNYSRWRQARKSGNVAPGWSIFHNKK